MALCTEASLHVARLCVLVTALCVSCRSTLPGVSDNMSGYRHSTISVGKAVTDGTVWPGLRGKATDRKYKCCITSV